MAFAAPLYHLKISRSTGNNGILQIKNWFLDEIHDLYHL
jgi:hypothetical protein